RLERRTAHKLLHCRVAPPVEIRPTVASTIETFQSNPERQRRAGFHLVKEWRLARCWPALLVRQDPNPPERPVKSLARGAATPPTKRRLPRWRARQQLSTVPRSSAKVPFRPRLPTAIANR